jgi:hypothetical protein
LHQCLPGGARIAPIRGTAIFIALSGFDFSPLKSSNSACFAFRKWNGMALALLKGG